MAKNTAPVVIPYDPAILERAQQIQDIERLTLEQRAAKRTYFDVCDQIEARLMRTPAKAVTANDARDRWIYRQCCKLTAYSSIRRALKRKATWTQLESDTAVRQAAARYADFHHLPPIPRRQPGRKRAKKI